VVERQAVRCGEPAFGRDPVFLALAIPPPHGCSLADDVANRRTVDRTTVDGRARCVRGLGGMAELGRRAVLSRVALALWFSE